MVKDNSSSETRHLRRAFALGAVVTALSIVLLLVVVQLWPWGWTDPSGVIAAQMAFAQVWASFLAIFLAGFLGFFAIREFAEAQERPSLRLGIEPDGLEEITLEPGSDRAFYSIAVRNEGRAAATWYLVEMRSPCFPNAVYQGPQLIEEWDEPPAKSLKPRVHAVVGSLRDNWKEFHNPAFRVWGKTFLSNGSIAALPGYPLVLCQFDIPLSVLGSVPTLVIDYQIAADRIPMKKGQIRVNLPPLNDQKPICL